MRATDQSKRFFRMALYAVGVAFVSVVFNSVARISEANIGCPEWPGCYGKLFSPQTAEELRGDPEPEELQKLERQHDQQEWYRRSLSVVLSFTLFRLVVLGWQLKRRKRAQQIWIPAATLLFTFALTFSGSFTFEYRYKPVALMVQLMGSMITLALLWWIALRENRVFRAVTPTAFSRSIRWSALFAIALVTMQILFGGWSMVNYAGLAACPDFPTCQGQWLPPMEFTEAFTAWGDIGLNYEGRVLTLPALTAIHYAHRIGALMVLVYVGWLGLRVLRLGYEEKLCRYGMLILLVLLAELGLGIADVMTRLPIVIAVAHNIFAALLLMSLVTLYHVVRPPRTL
jgi:cytochrome c oxidase assembly protein subunit 15